MNLDLVAEELKKTVSDVSVKLSKISDAEAKNKPAPGKWSKKEIIGHLIDSASNNHQRFVRAQYVKNLALPGYEQDAWVSIQGYNEHDWQELISLWKFYNLHLAELLNKVPEEKSNTLLHIGEDSNDPVTLGFVAKDYLRHLKHHLAQVGF